MLRNKLSQEFLDAFSKKFAEGFLSDVDLGNSAVENFNESAIKPKVLKLLANSINASELILAKDISKEFSKLNKLYKSLEKQELSNGLTFLKQAGAAIIAKRIALVYKNLDIKTKHSQLIYRMH